MMAMQGRFQLDFDDITWSKDVALQNVAESTGMNLNLAEPFITELEQSDTTIGEAPTVLLSYVSSERLPGRGSNTLFRRINFVITLIQQATVVDDLVDYPNHLTYIELIDLNDRIATWVNNNYYTLTLEEMESLELPDDFKNNYQSVVEEPMFEYGEYEPDVEGYSVYMVFFSVLAPVDKTSWNFPDGFNQARQDNLDTPYPTGSGDLYINDIISSGKVNEIWPE